MAKRLYLFFALLYLINFPKIVISSEAITLICDFSKYESEDYISKFIGFPKWQIVLDNEYTFLWHLNHSKRMSITQSERPIWLNKSGLYTDVEKNGVQIIARREQINFQSEIKIDLSNMKLLENFAIKRSTYGNAMDWNYEYAEAECSLAIITD